jgi:conjugative relaxase-like TrwC/TraI family protein
MLSLGKIAATPTAGLYYVEQVSQGLEDYYAGEGESPGAWVGAGVAQLGLAGVVGEQGILRLLNAQDPASGALLRQPLALGAVAGFDLTFRAPKSVSVLFGIADDEIVGEIRVAHQAAVGEALGYLEREACRARRGHGGATMVAGRGFVAAAFEHCSSRAGDPLLHTHVVVANATQGPDGRWTALDGRLLYRHAKTAGYLYQAALRAELTERLHVRWHAVERGTADVVGVPRGVIEHFSRRRAEILEHMAARGEHSGRAAQIATLETRRRKDYAVPRSRLREEWRARSAEHGLSRFRVRRILGRAPARAMDVLSIEQIATRLAGPEGLTRESSTFTRRDVVQAFAEAAPTGARVLEVEAQADAFLARHAVVELEPVSGQRRFTTRELLAIEHELLDGAARRRGEGVGLAREDELDEALDARPTLNDEQCQLISALTRSGDGVQVVRAAAGTGKTFALDAARQAWQASKAPVLGCALSARAACELRDQAGIDATTIARLRHALERGIELAPGSVLIVDEAGMVGTRDLSALAAAADCSRAKLVLVGDDRQLPEIDAGGAFRALAERLGTVELREVHRQGEPWDREALAALRDGDVERFARAYHDRGRLIAAPNADAARDALTQDWWWAYEKGDRALMIAHRRSDVADLNQRARTLLREAGHIGPDVLLTDELAFAVGDRVITTRNDSRLRVVNGQAGTLTAISDGRLQLELDAGQRVDLPERYALDGHLDHAYAITAHRAQGATVDGAYVLGSDELYREWGYTALSRHRDEARFYVTATPAFLNQAPEPLRDRDVPLHVARMLADSRAEHLAMDRGARRGRSRADGLGLER